ncbi:fimbrial protein [Gallibacterium anatis]|uniref:fimbrial protein n=1 Tax=Gallibacterium anatis TaxID=750 RepID=UPI00254B4F3C|nr:fimbrial protein [Gallibacterium anatis]WIM82129.1 fimbrial protein [Gallibacterium anatis]
MKKLLLTTLIAVGLGLSAQGAFADDSGVAINGGVLTVNGKVVNTTCTITNAENGNLLVTLPPVPASELNAKGKTTGETNVIFKLSGCKTITGQGSIATKAAAFFKFDADNVDDEGRLKNKASVGTAAENVLIELTHKDKGKTRIEVGSDYNAQTGQAGKYRFDIQDNAATLHYLARYYATGVATAGDVHSQVNYIIAYE